MPADLYKGSFMGENYKRKSIRNKVIILSLCFIKKYL